MEDSNEQSGGNPSSIFGTPMGKSFLASIGAAALVSGGVGLTQDTKDRIYRTEAIKRDEAVEEFCAKNDLALSERISRLEAQHEAMLVLVNANTVGRMISEKLRGE